MVITYPERRAGFDAMEKALTPLARTLRRFGAGKPISRPIDTPLGAVLLAVEQRERLRKILESDADTNDAHVTDASIEIQLKSAGVIGPYVGPPVLVSEGRESEAVKELEDLLDLGHRFTASGITFAVEAGGEKRVFQYWLGRTPQGEVALHLTADKLIPRRKK